MSKAKEAAAVIKRAKPNFKPHVAIVLGSGLGVVADSIEDKTVISYADIPGFPVGNVKGHAGSVALGYLKGVPVVCLQGRVHHYEGASGEAQRTMIHSLKAIGCEMLFSTNAAGSLRKEVGPGSLVALTDHINFAFHNPLIGPNDDEFGDRFCALDNAYDAEIRSNIHETAKEIGLELNHGVYVGVSGPSFETPAEIRAYKMLGGDLVGMSTVPEVIVARHCELKVAVVSVVTNLACGLAEESLSHEVTLRGAKLGADNLVKLILAYFEKLSEMLPLSDCIEKAEYAKADVTLREDIISLMDLTNLDDHGCAEDIIALCNVANSLAVPVAALCVYPRFVALANECLLDKQVQIATVVNFPSGASNINATLELVENSLAAGADEIDVVLPYQAFLTGDECGAVGFVRRCKQVCGTHSLKVILETGALSQPQTIYHASRMLLDTDVDFLKTSTGKIEQGASLDAAAQMLLAIKHSGCNAGFKASGGIRTLEQACQYLTLARHLMGEGWITPQHFRFWCQQFIKCIDLKGYKSMDTTVSFEFYPPKTEDGAQKLLACAEKLASVSPEFFSVTYGAGGSTQDRTMQTVLNIQKQVNIPTAPHLSCIGSTKKLVKSILDKYIEHDIKHIVALRGDIPSGSGLDIGEFHYANELVDFIRAETGDHFHIEVAAYPEYHPQSTSPGDDMKNFKRKVEAGADSAITQYFYNIDAYFYFVENARKSGIDIPIIPGIMPITNFEQLARFSDGCGTEIPRWIRRKLETYGEDKESLKAFGHEVVVNLCEQLLATGVPSIHFYTLNRANACLNIWNDLT